MSVFLPSPASSCPPPSSAPPLVHLERMGSMPEEVVRFYVAEISSALAFLHDKRIIHRYESPIRALSSFLSLTTPLTETSSQITSF